MSWLGLGHPTVFTFPNGSLFVRAHSFQLTYATRKAAFSAYAAAESAPDALTTCRQIELAVQKLPKELLIANYTVSPFSQIAKKQPLS